MSAGPGERIPAVDDTPQAAALTLGETEIKTIEYGVIEAVKTVFDPEIPVNIWELGLIYGIEVFPRGAVVIKMTLTAPACPAAEELPIEVETKVRAIPGVTDVKVEIVWEPAWNKDMMSDGAKLRLGFF